MEETSWRRPALLGCLRTRRKGRGRWGFGSLSIAPYPRSCPRLPPGAANLWQTPLPGINIFLPRGARVNYEPLWTYLCLHQHPAPFQTMCEVPPTQASLSCSMRLFSELGFQQTGDAPKGEKAFHRERGSKAVFLLPPPLFCSHYGPGILLPQHGKQRTGLKGPSSLCSSHNCL